VAKSSLVIVESPTKAKTIRKFLPKGFEVEASMGHVRDLPQSASDIPKNVKDEEWSKLGVNVEADFEPLYIVPKNKSKVISELKRKLKDADVLYLATDEDREGESIAWHLHELLKPKVPVKRMVFHEITKTAIEKALKEVRDVDSRLVRAQETRRILDRLVGYTLSPLLWKKISFGLSAGRVQSVALRLIVDRERERVKFVKADYWDLGASLAKGGEAFDSKLLSVGGERIATGKDFDENTGKLAAGKKDVRILGEKEAKELLARLKAEKFVVQSIEEKPLSSRPSPPFITSTLQQEANRKLGLSARDSMRVAQGLYEEGLITYMRTDSPNLSQEAIKAARSAVKSLYGDEYLSDEPRQFTSKAKGAQEAHEAIRPAGNEFVHPKETGLSGIQLALYDLIWKRTMATQMAEAKKLSVSARIEAGNAVFSASGTRILFAGFMRAYVEGADDPEAALEDREVVLPALKAKDTVDLKKIEALAHETKPPARFTEASLVQTLEKEGIGRPSTYASILGTIVERGYVRKVGNALVPTFTGFAVTQLLQRHFESFVDPGFTSKMEESLDEIAEGKVEWLPYLKKFYLGKDGLATKVKEQDKKIKPEESRTVEIFKHLKDIEIKIGRYGAYLVKSAKDGEKKEAGADEVHASIPEDIAPADLTPQNIEEILELSEKGPQSIGKEPKSGLDIYCLTGRYGAYVQLGPTPEDKDAPKPRRASLPKGVAPKDITIELALKLLSLPRELGSHPDTGEPIVANNGRFGPYVVHQKNFRSLKKTDDVYTVDIKRALELLSEEKKGRGGASMVKDLGKHPEDQQPVGIYDGKYGLYVKHGKVNATLPKDANPENVTMKEALELLGARVAAGKTKVVRGRGRRR
jgi:DNA topoisomerase-1